MGQQDSTLKNSVKPKQGKLLTVKKILVKKIKYMKCLSCPMAASITINKEQDAVITNCENGHQNIFQIDQYLNLIRVFNYICCRCRAEKDFVKYCFECKENFCSSCLSIEEEKIIHKSHHIMDDDDINFICHVHKRKFTHFCEECTKNLCTKCLNDHNSHSILNLSSEEVSKSFISKLENMLKEEENILKLFEDKYKGFIDIDEKIKEDFKKIRKIKLDGHKLKQKLLNTYSKRIEGRKRYVENRTETKVENRLDDLKPIKVKKKVSNASEEKSENDDAIKISNYYFLKNINALADSIYTNVSQLFKVDPKNKNYKKFQELIDYLKKQETELNIKNKEKSCQIISVEQKAKYIFPLNNGNFIATFPQDFFIFSSDDGELELSIDDQCLDDISQIVQLRDGSLLTFGRFLNHIKLLDNNIEILFTGGSCNIIKGIEMSDNEVIAIDFINELRIINNKGVNWHKEYYPYDSKDNSSPVTPVKEGKTIDKDNDTPAKCTKKDLFKAFLSENKKSFKKTKTIDISNIKKKTTYDILKLNQELFAAVQCNKSEEELNINIYNFINYTKVNSIKCVECDKDLNTLHNFSETMFAYSLKSKNGVGLVDIKNMQTVKIINIDFERIYDIGEELIICYYKDNLIQYLKDKSNLRYIFVSKIEVEERPKHIISLVNNDIVVHNQNNLNIIQFHDK